MWLKELFLCPKNSMWTISSFLMECRTADPFPLLLSPLPKCSPSLYLTLHRQKSTIVALLACSATWVPEQGPTWPMQVPVLHSFSMNPVPIMSPHSRISFVTFVGQDRGESSWAQTKALVSLHIVAMTGDLILTLAPLAEAVCSSTVLLVGKHPNRVWFLFPPPRQSTGLFPTAVRIFLAPKTYL
ncbi:hypothetical protein O181_045609 [Austropuccinia psidii MF-1]|uniref:Uncharacterized protein n=1 Tax=Austropuccinia psidii MF-1 TaxID=1389203 RepID=A0A9Q3DMD0_9BASI|nr:hypothetical protein [Austropuccinia psidii MF-1]